MDIKRNTLLISEMFPPKVGGSGRWFWEIYSRLPRDRYIIAAGEDEQSGKFDLTHDLKCLRWPLTLPTSSILSLEGIKSYYSIFLRLRTLLKLEGISAIHCGRCLPEGLLCWLAYKWAGVPYLCYVHGEELATYHTSKEYTYLSRLIYSNAYRIIVNSENTKSSLADYAKVYGNHVRMMHPGVDTNYFIPKETCSIIRNKLGWDNRKIILTISRLQKRKGHDHVILALRRIKERFPNILYAIVGDGEERNHLEELVNKELLKEYVQFMGQVDDDTVLACYQQCDLFVLANREVNGDFEGFGMVLVEAQACGKPVIAGKSGGTAETMVSGETGLLVDSNNPETIADAVIQLMRNDEMRNIMGKKAVEWVRTTFDWGVLMVQAEEIFQGLLTDDRQ